MTDDKDIITAIRQHTEEGFRLLMTRYKEPVYWHIRRLVVSHADAQDATQETFVRIFRSFGQYNDDHSFRAWVFRIATNEALRLLGRQRGETLLSLEESTDSLLRLKADTYFDDSDALVAKLQKAILTLPAKQQLAFNLRYYDELSYEEIAEVAGSTPASMKVSYNIAKEKIVKYMQAND